MKNNEIKDEGAKREQRKKNKKIYSTAKENLVRGHSFWLFAKKV